MTIPKVDPWTTTSICMCDRCKGTGIGKRSEVTNYHDYTEDEWNVLCDKCDGEGRLLKLTHNYRVELNGVSYNNRYQNFVRETYEKLNGKTTSDIYKIGRRV